MVQVDLHLFTPSEERVESGLYTQKYLKEQLMVALGGRVAEEIQFGEEQITSGVLQIYSKLEHWLVKWLHN